MDEFNEIRERLAKLEDRRAIEDLKHRYTAALDFGYDLDAIAGCFTPAGRWVADGFGDCRGHDSIRVFFGRVSKATPQTLHYATSPRIEIAADGLTAVASFYLLNLSSVRRRDSDEVDAVVVLGTYEDQCVKVDGKWLFDELRVYVRSVSDWTEGWARQPWRWDRHTGARLVLRRAQNRMGAMISSCRPHR